MITVVIEGLPPDEESAENIEGLLRDAYFRYASCADHNQIVVREVLDLGVVER